MAIMETMVHWIVYIFSDLIFMHLFGWCIRPLYNLVERTWATVLADCMLILIEFIFYGIVIALLVKLFDKILRKKGDSKQRRLENNLEKIEAMKARENANAQSNVKESTKDIDNTKSEEKNTENTTFERKKKDPSKHKKGEYRQYV